MSVKEAAVANLFDASGRRIAQESGAPVNKADSRYALAQPDIDFHATHARITEHLNGSKTMSAAEFADRAAALLDTLRGRDDVGALANGVRVPFLLTTGDPGDLGATFETRYLSGLAGAWKARFPKYDFKNEVTGLAGKISIAPGSRYEQLVAAMADGPVVGWYFPLALSGFSVPAALQHMADLPASMVLAGGFEAAAALVGCPDLIMKTDGYPPQLDLAAWRAPVAGYGYHFAPYGYNLTFNGRYHNNLASDYCASGLTLFAASSRKK
jgi:hypothetical protein